MLLDFLIFLAPNQTEKNEIVTRDSGLQALLGKYDNGTGGAMEFIQRVNGTLIRIEETEEESENKTRRIETLEQEKDGLEKRNGQCRNTISSQNQTINSLQEEVGRIRVSLGQKEKDARDKTRSIQELRQKGSNLESEKEQLENRVSSQSQTINRLNKEANSTLITIRRTEEDVENKAQRIQFLEENEDRLEKSVKELQNLTISQRESLDWMTAEMENLNETLSWKIARCPVDTHLNGFQTTRGSSLAFSRDLYEAVKESQPENFVLSPLSLRNALAMLSLGAAGETAEEFQKVLQLPADASDLINRQSNLISSLKSISSSKLGLRFATGDAIFTNSRIRVKHEFRDHVTVIGGETERVNFGNGEEAAGRINAWVQRKTVGKIDKIVEPSDLNDQISLLVLNTIYFKGAWKNKFNKSETKPLAFFPNESCSLTVDMMTQENKFQIADLEEAQAQVIVLPYKGERLSMMIYLPFKRGNPEGVLDTLENWLKDQSPFDIQTEYLGEPETVKVSLPKFKIRSSLDLNEPLKKSGLEKMFDSAAANFSGIFEDSGNRFVSKVSQETFMEVNEEGTEAAAVTGFEVSATSVGSVFKANRPFLFQIVNKETKTVLFSGRVKNPLDSLNSLDSNSTEGNSQCLEATSPPDPVGGMGRSEDGNFSCIAKPEVEEMLYDFLLSTNKTEPTKSTSRDSDLDALFKKYGNETTKATDVIHSINNTLDRLDKHKNQAQEIEKLQAEIARLKNTTKSKSQGANTTCPPYGCSSHKPRQPCDRAGKEEQNHNFYFPPAAARIHKCRYYNCYRTSFTYNATVHGSCYDIGQDVQSVRLTGTCVNLYQNGDCSGTKFRMDKRNSDLGQEIRLQFPRSFHLILGYNTPKSIGPCLGYVDEG